MLFIVGVRKTYFEAGIACVGFEGGQDATRTRWEFLHEIARVILSFISWTTVDVSKGPSFGVGAAVRSCFD